MRRLSFIASTLGLALSGLACGRTNKRSPQSKRAEEAAARVRPNLEQDLSRQKLVFGAPIYLRIFKEERILECWIQAADQETYTLFRSYPIVAMSGQLGPKLKQGDRQAPEGFYRVPPSMMNPRSRFHLAFNLGYPNAYDQAHKRTGDYLMVHGNQVSIGCFAMTHAKIEEIYTLCDAALLNGQPAFEVHAFPFRMTAERMQAAEGNPWLPFWQNLKEGYDLFERTKRPPKIRVLKQRYVFE